MPGMVSSPTEPRSRLIPGLHRTLPYSPCLTTPGSLETPESTYLAPDNWESRIMRLAEWIFCPPPTRRSLAPILSIRRTPPLPTPTIVEWLAIEDVTRGSH